MRPFLKEPLTGFELRALIGGRPVREFFSLKSPSFPKLGLDPDGLTEAQMIALMTDAPRFKRRALVVAGDRVIMGNDGTAFKQALG